VAGWRQRAQEMFVPLVPPGHAQADFGEAIGIIGGATATFERLHSSAACRSRSCILITK
jgi:hypothetical protein